LGIPESIAQRIRRDKLFQTFGIGIIGIAPSGQVQIVRAARRTKPKVWSYYFALASEAAAHLSRSRSRAVHNVDRRRKRAVSKL